MISKLIMCCSLVIGSAAVAMEVQTESEMGLLDDSEVSQWNIPAPEVLPKTKQILAGQTNLVNKSYLFAELSGWTEGKWKVQVYETIMKEMYVKQDNEARWIADGVVSAKSTKNNAVLVDSRDDAVRHEISALSNKDYVLVQVEYVDLHSLQSGRKSLDGSYVKKQVFVAKDRQGGAITLSYVKQPHSIKEEGRPPMITRFFEVLGGELRTNDDKCTSNDMIYSFADIDRSGDLVMYFGYAGYQAIVRCDKKDLLRYVGILAEPTSATAHQP